MIKMLFPYYLGVILASLALRNRDSQICSQEYQIFLANRRLFWGQIKQSLEYYPNYLIQSPNNHELFPEEFKTFQSHQLDA